VIDWHNFGWSMLALRLGADHPIVRLAHSYERHLGRLAHSHFCVSRAMQRQLAENCGVSGAIVLYDHPADHFEPVDSSARPKLLRGLLTHVLPEDVLWHDESRRPACVVCPTSWSEDEDFSLLLDAVSHLDARIRERASGTGDPAFPRLLVLITGLGPLREHFEARIARLDLGFIQIRTAWFSAEDYARLLSAADLGLCFHRSSSGFDLPMKLADMVGAGLPACAFDYGACLAERFSHRDNGLLFRESRELAEQLFELFAGFPEKTPELDRLRRSVESRAEPGWTAEWQELASAVLLGEDDPSREPEETAVAASPSGRPLRVAFFHPNLGFGGAERWLVDAATSLVDAGHRVVIVTTSHDPDRSFQQTRDGSLDVRVRGNALPAHVGKRLRAPCTIIRTAWAVLSTAVRGERFDLAVVDLIPHVIPLVRTFLRVPIVYYCHYPDQLFVEPSSLAQRLYRRPIELLEEKGAARADRILANSNFTAAALSRVQGDRVAESVQVLYPGVDCAKRESVEDTAAPVGTDEHLLLCVSRFDRRKRLGLAVQALAMLASRIDSETFRRTQLILAGSYDAASGESELALREIETLAEQLGVSERVRYLKSPSDATRQDLLSKCRCLIYTPKDEHFGLVPLEAMAAGRPVVAARSGGPLETIRDGVTGLLCNPTPEAFADALASLLLDRAASDRMGDAGREWVSANFSLEAFAEQWTALIEEVAASGR
jgi:alpha-1,3/alpha-1,6-mannosyltransferase